MEEIIVQFNWRTEGKKWTGKNRLGQLPPNLKSQKVFLIHVMDNAVYLYFYYISAIKRIRKVNLV